MIVVRVLMEDGDGSVILGEEEGRGEEEEGGREEGEGRWDIVELVV